MACSSCSSSLSPDLTLCEINFNNLNNFSPHVRESGIRNPTFFCLWNPESRALESGIQSLESAIQPVESEIQPHPQHWNPGLECTVVRVIIPPPRRPLPPPSPKSVWSPNMYIKYVNTAARWF